MSRLTAHQGFLNHGISVPDRSFGKPELPGWLLALPGVSTVVDRLGPAEFRRRLIHMSPALMPMVLPFVPHRDVWGPLLLGVLASVTILGLIIALQFGSQVKRTAQEKWHLSVLGYVIPVIAAVIFFPGQGELALMTLEIIALGDGSATVGGLLLGGRKLPWNAKKTFSGLFCFVIFGTLASTLIYCGEARPAVPVLTALLVCVVTATAAAIVESLPIKSHDNLRVGLTAITVGSLMTSLLV